MAFQTIATCYFDKKFQTLTKKDGLLKEELIPPALAKLPGRLAMRPGRPGHGRQTLEREPWEVFRISPKYCASLPGEYIDSALAFLPALREMGYHDRDLAEGDVFDTRAIEKVHKGRHHYD